MLVSDAHKFLFLEVPKTASSSMKEELLRYADETQSAEFSKHVTANKLCTELGPQYLQRYTSFAFVREPYSWLYSWYSYRQRDNLQDGTHPFHERHTRGKTFDQFVDTVLDDEVFLRQSDFICTRGGKTLVDYVGRYENLDSDFKGICEKLNLATGVLATRNASQGNGFSPDMVNSANRRTINRYFHADFEIFGYEKIF